RRPDAEGVLALRVEAMRVAIDVEEHFLQHVARVGLARVAAQATGDLDEQVLAVELVEETESPASGLLPEDLHQPRRGRVAQGFAVARGVRDESRQRLPFARIDLRTQVLDPRLQPCARDLSSEGDA